MLMKIFAKIILFMMSTLSIQAQEFPLRFVDSLGNEVSDGSVLDLTEVEDLGFGDVQIPSGLYVENITSEDVVCGTEYTITALPNGAFQTCFPKNCVMRESTGNWQSETGTMAAYEKKSIQTEWLPFDAGTAVAEFQLLKYKMNPVTQKYAIDARGPKVTMRFIYNPTRTLNTFSDLRVVSTTYHTLDGRCMSSPNHGLYIMRIAYSDGTVKTIKRND